MGVFTKIILTSRWLKVLIYTDLIVVQTIYQFDQSFWETAYMAVSDSCLFFNFGNCNGVDG